MFFIGKKLMLKESNKEYWQKYWLSSDHQPEVVHEELIKQLLAVTDVSEKEIMEIGVGMGGDSLFLAKEGANITILDFSPEALTMVEKSAKDRGLKIKTILADAKDIPFKDETFDIVFHQGFLEHFVEPETYLQEQRRVLKRGGYLVVDVPQKFTTYTIKKHRQMKQGKWFAGWEKEFSIEELKRLLTKANFNIISVYGWGYYGKLYKIRHLRLGKLYENLWNKIEKSKLKLYLNFSIGVIAQKK